MSSETNQLQPNEILSILEKRFQDHTNRHPKIEWSEIEKSLNSNPKLLEVVTKMELTGGEPDVISLGDNLYFVDCSKESPKDRRSLCFDQDAWEKRKQHKPSSTVEAEAAEIGIGLLTETDYLEWQKFGPFDEKTSSWIETPKELRKLGGALFGDYRFGRTFIYHNGAASYYGSRGFRGKIKIH